jgi:hypothetical protein
MALPESAPPEGEEKHLTNGTRRKLSRPDAPFAPRRPGDPWSIFGWQDIGFVEMKLSHEIIGAS